MVVASGSALETPGGRFKKHSEQRLNLCMILGRLTVAQYEMEA